MAIIEGWLPPTRENYNLILTVWQIAYPIVSKSKNQTHEKQSLT
jgi:hypothetical protein